MKINLLSSNLGTLGLLSQLLVERELVIKRDHPTNTLSGQHLRDLGILLLIYGTIYLSSLAYFKCFDLLACLLLNQTDFLFWHPSISYSRKETVSLFVFA